MSPVHLPAHIEDYRTTVDTLENIMRTYPPDSHDRIILQAAANIAGARLVALARAWREEHVAAAFTPPDPFSRKV